MKEITLRDYQQECVDIIDEIDKGGSFLVVMATGLGKTAIFSHIKRKGRVLILSHREELVHQPEQYYGCSFGVERAEESSHGEDVISASVQTLVRRLKKFKPDEFDTIITDEAHHAVAPSYQKIYGYFKPRLHLGFTATPNRADNLKLGKVFSKVIFEKDIRWGIKKGYLSDIRCIRANIGYDLRDVRSQMGDFNQSDLEKAIDITQVNEEVARVYEQCAIDPTLIFAASVEHANNLAAVIKGAKVVTADTPDRAEILKGFAEGTVKVIVNCMVLTEGTDLPMVRTIMMCRPTQNASLFTQAVGRGLRLYKDKKELLLIDCTGVSRLPLCSAPVLFGIDPKRAEKVLKDGMLLTELDEELKEEERSSLKSVVEGNWKINLSIVNLFEKNGGYDTHNVNFTMCANGDMLVSLGEGIVLTVTAEDITGNSTVITRSYGKVTEKTDDMPMQDALDYVYRILSTNYASSMSLWDRERCLAWGKWPATDKQKSFIKSLYTEEELKPVNLVRLTKYEAGCLINQGLERQRVEKERKRQEALEERKRRKQEAERRQLEAQKAREEQRMETIRRQAEILNALTKESLKSELAENDQGEQKILSAGAIQDQKDTQETQLLLPAVIDQYLGLSVSSGFSTKDLENQTELANTDTERQQAKTNAETL